MKKLEPESGALAVTLGAVKLGGSVNRVPQNRPKYLTILIIRTAKMGTLMFGNSQVTMKAVCRAADQLIALAALQGPEVQAGVSIWLPSRKLLGRTGGT